MDRNELYKMFNLDPHTPEEDQVEVDSIEFEDGSILEQIIPKFSESAVSDLSDWEIYQGGLVNKSQYRQAGLNDLAAGDFFALCFRREPKLVDQCKDETRLAYIKAITETTDYQTLHGLSLHNVTVSKMSADSLIKEYCKLLEQIKTKKTDLEREIDILDSAQKATEGAKEEAKELDSFITAMDGKSDEGIRKADMTKLSKMYNKMKHSQALKKINEYSGSFFHCAMAEQKKKVLHGYDDVIGVELTGEVHKLVPHELGLLAHPKTKLMAYQKLLENQSMGRKYQGVESMAKGPSVFVVDTSGSMKLNDFCYKAKAMALAYARVSKNQNRWCCLVDYSGWTVSTGTYGWKHVIMKPGNWDHDGLMEWLEHFWDGGSCEDVPVMTMPDKWKELGCPKGVTDITMVTDAVADFKSEVIERFNQWKKEENAKVTTIVIGLGGNTDQVRQYSDKVFQVADISVNEAAIKDSLAL